MKTRLFNGTVLAFAATAAMAAAGQSKQTAQGRRGRHDRGMAPFIVDSLKMIAASCSE